MSLTSEDLKQIRKIVKEELKPVNEKLDLTIRFFDNEYLQLKARVERIESFLKITPLTS